ncbi:MAG: hypothetical protein O9284_02760 [Steroidobacteraceae bacterium]|jgi:hypothetical protein|nr:hypothetical protein [Steroidobacteraceae bacterium]
MNADARPPAASHAPGTQEPPAIPPELVRKRRIQLVLLALVFFGPVLLATVMYVGGFGTPSGRVNVGELVQPPRPLPDVALPTPDGRLSSPGVLRGKWSLVYVGEGACTSNCLQVLDDLRAVRLALDRDATRIQRVFLYEGQCCGRELLAGGPVGVGLVPVALDGAREIRDAFTFDGVPAAQANHVYVVDPMGVVMMRHALPVDRRGMVKDLEKLLKLSQIG